MAEVHINAKERRGDRLLCHKCNMRLWRARNPMRDAFNNLRNSANKRRIGFALTFEEFQLICNTTGYLKQRGSRASSLQIDRVDNLRGYEVGNISVISCSENTAKGNRERRVQMPNGAWVEVTAIRVGAYTIPQGHDEDCPF